MITIKEELRAALSGVCGEVVYGYPRDFTGDTLVGWRESGNARHAQADGREYLAELEYTLEIFAPAPEAAADLLAACDERMRGIGLRRESSAEVFEENAALCHISARYRALADIEGNIYQ
ncbi:MAG: hypothetical protein IJ466_12580 [Clostridia bacterium]|nr:hypothetical protein [Clostridia bacterium]